MDISQEGSVAESNSEQYSAQEEINQFMSRFLGFVRRDNFRFRRSPEQLRNIGNLTVSDLSAALSKIDDTFHCLDLERIRSAQYSIKLEAISSLNSRKASLRSESVVGSAEATLRGRCDALQEQITNMKNFEPLLRTTLKKQERLRKSRVLSRKRVNATRQKMSIKRSTPLRSFDTGRRLAL